MNKNLELVFEDRELNIKLLEVIGEWVEIHELSTSADDEVELKEIIKEVFKKWL